MNNASRSAILSDLRKQIPIEVPALPEVIEGNWIRYDDPIAQFAGQVKFVGGMCEVVKDVGEVLARLRQYPEFNEAKRVYSQVPGIDSQFDLDGVEKPQDLEDLDFVIYPGQFGIAENGAIWLTDSQLKHRVIFFIAQHLVLILPKNALVHTMHEAYSRVKFEKPGFGLFLSGPSKTADIEQSLVIGAHGCKSLQVYLIDAN